MKKLRIFGDIEKEEQWLNEMNAQGYEFVKKVGCSYEFAETKEKGKFRYCIDVKRIRNTEFIEFMDSLNIKLISKSMMLYYYQIPDDCSVQGLYTDFKSKIFLCLRYMLGLLLVGIINVLILHDAQGPYVLNISIPFVFNLVMLMAVVYAMLRCAKNIMILLRRDCEIL